MGPPPSKRCNRGNFNLGMSLVPELPSMRAPLLLPASNLLSSPAVHTEANGYSGIKLAEYFGFWLPTVHRVAGARD